MVCWVRFPGFFRLRVFGGRVAFKRGSVADNTLEDEPPSASQDFLWQREIILTNGPRGRSSGSLHFLNPLGGRDCNPL